MKLYNVTFEVVENYETEAILVPYVPHSAGDGEDKTIPRVCLSDSVEHCMQAIASCNREIKNNSTFILREVEVNEDDKRLVYPKQLKEKGYVPDAIENQEYWFLAPINAKVKLCSITDFSSEFDIAWGNLEKNDVIEILSRHAILNYSECSAKEAHRIFLNYAEKNKMWDAMDEVWEEIAELDWAQITRITKVDYDILE